MKSFKSHQPTQQAPRTAGSVVGKPPSVSKDKLEEAAWDKEMAAKAAEQSKSARLSTDKSDAGADKKINRNRGPKRPGTHPVW